MRAIRALSVGSVVALLVALLPAVAAALDGSTADSFTVVVNENVPVSRLSKTDLARIFLKKQVEWSNGESVVPVDQSTISMVRARFTEFVHEKKMSAITNYWQKQIFTGRGVPPPIRGTDQEVIEFVRSTPGAIGYVSAAAPTAGVKTVAVQ